MRSKLAHYACAVIHAASTDLSMATPGYYDYRRSGYGGPQYPKGPPPPSPSPDSHHPKPTAPPDPNGHGPYHPGQPPRPKPALGSPPYKYPYPGPPPAPVVQPIVQQQQSSGGPIIFAPQMMVGLNLLCRFYPEITDQNRLPS